jgi:hypothetical protein
MISDCNVDGNHNYFHSDHNSRARIDFGCNQSLADYHDWCLKRVQMTIVALFGYKHLRRVVDCQIHSPGRYSREVERWGRGPDCLGLVHFQMAFFLQTWLEYFPKQIVHGSDHFVGQISGFQMGKCFQAI